MSDARGLPPVEEESERWASQGSPPLAMEPRAAWGPPSMAARSPGDADAIRDRAPGLEARVAYTPPAGVHGGSLRPTSASLAQGGPLEDGPPSAAFSMSYGRPWSASATVPTRTTSTRSPSRPTSGRNPTAARPSSTGVRSRPQSARLSSLIPSQAAAGYGARSKSLNGTVASMLWRDKESLAEEVVELRGAARGTEDRLQQATVDVRRLSAALRAAEIDRDRAAYGTGRPGDPSPGEGGLSAAALLRRPGGPGPESSAQLVSRLKSRIRDLLAERAELDTQLRGIKSSVKVTRTAELEAQNDALLSELRRLQALLAVAHMQQQQLAATVSDQQATGRSRGRSPTRGGHGGGGAAAAERDDLAAQVRWLEEQNSGLYARTEAAEADREAHARRAAEAEAQAGQATDGFRELDASRHDTELRLASLQSQHDDAVATITSLQAQLAAATAEAAGAVEREAVTRSALTIETRAREAAERERATADDSRRLAESRRDDAAAAKVAADAGLSAVTAQRDDAAAGRDKLAAVVAALEAAAAASGVDDVGREGRVAALAAESASALAESASLRRELDDARGRANVLALEAEGLRDTLAESLAAREEHARSLAAVHAQLITAGTETAASAAAAQAAEARADAAERALVRLRAEMDDATGKGAAVGDEVASLRSAIAAAEAESVRLAALLAEERRNAEIVGRTSATAMADKAEIEAALATALAAAASSAAETAELSSHLAQAKTDNDAWAAAYENAETKAAAELAAAAAELDAARSEAAAATAALGGGPTGGAVLVKQMSMELSAARQAQRDAAAAPAAELAQLKAAHAALQAEHDEVVAAASLGGNASALATALAAELAALKAAVAESDSARAAEAESAHSAAEYTAKAAVDAAADHARLVADHATLVVTAARAEDRVAALESEVASLTSSAADIRAAAIRDAKVDMAASLATLEEGLSQLDARSKAADRDRAALVATAAELEAERAALEEHRAQLEAYAAAAHAAATAVASGGATPSGMATPAPDVDYEQQQQEYQQQLLAHQQQQMYQEQQQAQQQAAPVVEEAPPPPPTESPFAHMAATEDDRALLATLSEPAGGEPVTEGDAGLAPAAVAPPAREYLGPGKMLADFTADEPEEGEDESHELTVAGGTTVLAEYETGGWLMVHVTEADGTTRSGLVPANYVQMAAPAPA